MLDSHLHHCNALGIDTRRITWPRTHRHERPRPCANIIVGLGGAERRPAREERFVIIPGSEIMGHHGPATASRIWEQRLARIIVGLTFDKKPCARAT